MSLVLGTRSARRLTAWRVLLVSLRDDDDDVQFPPLLFFCSSALGSNYTRCVRILRLVLPQLLSPGMCHRCSSSLLPTTTTAGCGRTEGRWQAELIADVSSLNLVVIEPWEGDKFSPDLERFRGRGPGKKLISFLSIGDRPRGNK